MNICFILEHAYPHQGGVEKSFHELAHVLVKRGHKVTVLSSQSGGIQGAHIVSGVQYHYFPWKSYFNHALPEKKDIEPFIKRSDIVHTTTYTAAPIASRLSAMHHKPCVIAVHEVLGKKWYWIESNIVKATAYFLFEQYVLHQHCNMYNTGSEATKKDMVAYGIPADKIAVIYHGVDYGYVRQEELTNKIHNHTFLYFGRPGKTKGLFVLLEAIRLLHNTLPEKYIFRFVLGNDPAEERARFEHKVQEYKLETRITISPSLPQDELIKTIAQSYCIIVPSITEGFGFTAVETSALHRPLIISDAGSLPEVAYGRVLMFKNRDFKDLAQKIQKAVEGEFSIVPEKKFNWDITATKIEHLYNTLLNKE